MNTKTKKFLSYFSLLTLIFNLFSPQIFAQKNELFMKHDLTQYLDFGNFKINLDENYNLKNENGAYFYQDGGSGTGDVSLNYDAGDDKNKRNVKVGRTVTSSGYALILSGWTYEDGGGNGASLGWIKLSHDTKSNNLQNPIDQNTLLQNSDYQNADNFGVWINQSGNFQGKGIVDNNSSDVIFTGSSAINPKPFDIDGDGLLNTEEAKIFLGKNNVGNIDGDGFTDGEKDWDSDGDTFNDKLDPFPMDPNKNNCTLDIKPTPNFCKDNGDGTWSLDDSVFKDANGNWIDTDGDGLSDFLEYQFGTDKNNLDTDGDGLSDFLEYQFGLDPNDSTDANKDFDNDGLTNKSEILGLKLEINYTDPDGNSQSYAGTFVTDPWNNDTDGDYKKDGDEKMYGTDPKKPDTDLDGIPDGTDPYPLDGTNNGQDITNIGGVDWSDDDDDGLPAWWEDNFTNGSGSNALGTNKIVINDGNNGNTEIDASGSGHTLDKTKEDSDGDTKADPYEDFDQDGLTNYKEYQAGTNPNNWDSDGDHLGDKEDKFPNTPLDPNGDEDSDTIKNIDEIDGWTFDLEYKDASCNNFSSGSFLVHTKYDNEDTDGDGLFDNEEKQKGTNPLVLDTDGDGFSDEFEILVGSNPLNACSSDANAVPIDKDSDGLLNKFETKYSQCGASTGVLSMTGSFQNGFSTEILDCETDEYKLIDVGDGDNPDSNNNGIYDKSEDFDNDGLSNFQEQARGTNPMNWDTDMDGIPDNIDPNPNDSIDMLQDTDGDGLSDKIEILGINLSYSYKKDVNGTCTNFSFNKKVFLNYEKIDSDGDGLSDKYEIQNGLDPSNPDIDGDGWLDGEEINLGTNPKNGCSGAENIPVDNDGDGLAKIFEDRYTNGKNQGNKIFILKKIVSGGNTIYKSDPETGDDGNKNDYKLIDNVNGENSDSDGDSVYDGNEDFDNDGFSNKIEQIKGTNPNNWDTDGDGIPDNIDVNPTNSGAIITATGNIVNPNVDQDIYGPDSDGDGLSDKYENKIGTDPNNSDSDGDGIPDGIEVAAKRLGDINGDPNDNTKKPTDTDGDYLPDVFENLYNNFDINNKDGNLGEKFGGNGKFDGFEDNDNDGIINIFELIYGTDPNNNDTDGDGVLDGVEITASKLGDLNGNPIDSQKKPMDADKDGLSDIYEEKYPDDLDVKIKNFTGSTFFDKEGDLLNNFEEQKKGTDPNNNDTDGDGIFDSIDIFPTDANNGGFFTVDQLNNLLKNIDTDFDGISDYDEVNNTNATDPNNPDTDGDGVIDGIELILSKDPFNDPNSDPLDPLKTPTDTDGDLLPDVFENYNFSMGTEFETNFNLGNYFKMKFDKKNTYSNNFIDAFADADHDGVSNLNELLNGTNPYDETDFNSTSIKVPNENLVNYILPLDGDYDGDGISNLEEFNLGTDPRNKDSDGDGFDDGVEKVIGTNLLNSDNKPEDSNSNGIPDKIEQSILDKYGVDISSKDSSWFYQDDDGDGLLNIGEIIKGANLFDWDTDNDGVPDGVDSNPVKGNLQGSYNLYLDSDGDGLSDAYEIAMKKYWGGTGNTNDKNNFDEHNANLPASGWDSDGDGLADLFEDFNHKNSLNFTTLNKNDKNTYDGGTSPVGDGKLLDKYFDIDGDGLSNFDELLLGTNPYSIDTDGDGIPDNIDLNPIVFGNGVDTDSDGIPDFIEIHGFTGTVLILDNGTVSSETDLKFFTNALKYDSDGDGLSDGYERYHQLNPLLKDTDNDGWEDGVEVNVSYIDKTKGNPNDKSIFPTDSDGDGLADEWENYYVGNLTDLTKSGDFDGDGISDFKEMEIGSDPTINNFVLHFITNPLTSDGTCDWTNKGETISVISPLNLNNLDKNNSGFFTYENQAKNYSGNNFALPNSIYMPTSEGKWINNNQNSSNLKGSLVSAGSYTNNSNPLGPNKFEITIKGDSYKPYVGFKTIDLISGMLPDPNFNTNELTGFIYNQKKNEKDLYLGQSCVDATPPVCGSILSGGNHEQNHGLNIPVKWDEITGWESLDGTASGKYLSNRASTGSSIDETKKFNPFKKILSSLGIGEHKYNGDFEVKSNGYIPWTTGTGSNTDLSLNFTDYYNDNLSGLENNSEIQIFNQDQSVLGFSGSNLSNTNSNGGVHNLCKEYDSSDKCIGTGSLSGIKAGIKIFDKAGNYNYCESAVSKVDNQSPLVKINSIKDYNDEIDSTFITQVGELFTNKGYTFNIDLDDTITYNGDTYDFSVDGTNVSNGYSGFNPNDFGKGKILYCGKGNTDSEACIDDIISHSTDKNYLDTKYLYNSSSETSSGVFATGSGDLTSPDGILFEKDAYFSNTGVIIENISGSKNYLELQDNGDFLNGSGNTVVYNKNDFNIKIGNGTGSDIEQVLFIENGTHSGAYLSSSLGLYKIDETNGWNPSGIKILNENRMLGENEIPKRSGKVAFKIYSKQGAQGTNAGDHFYLSFNFMDRAGNGLPLKYGFALREYAFAKILGNVQSGQKTKTFDQNVQTFKMKESVVKNNVEKVKTNISDILANAKTLNGSGILVEKLSDLNPYKISLGDESIYLVKNGDIILGTGSSTLNLKDNYGKPVSIITYGGNILFNSKYIKASENTAFVSLIDPYLSQTSSKTLESQGNILINPELLIGKGQLVAEGSIMSYAVMNHKIQTIFNLDERRTIFKNQLVWDGTMISNNTVGGYYQGTCPISIYGFENSCGLDKNTDLEELKAVSLTYDLHYLRTFTINGNTSKLNDSGINRLTISNNNNITKRMNDQFGSGSNLLNLLSNKEIDNNTLFNTTQVLNQSTGDINLDNITKGLNSLFAYPIIIKHSTPTKDMRIFK